MRNGMICALSIPEIASVLTDSAIRSQYEKLIVVHMPSIADQTRSDMTNGVNNPKELRQPELHSNENENRSLM